ncbi:MAG TPA: cadmium-translocating P-type ATPase [Acholeplasmataceae bacterium]|nr:cadmium-translocating P-type ATPase [Acholeplasmataceae bacterium]
MKKFTVITEAVAVVVATILIIIAYILDSSPREGYLVEYLYVFAFLIGGFAKAKEGIKATIEDKSLNVEILMILAAIGAFIVGEFSEGAILIFIFAVSGVLESYATQQSEKNLTALLKLAPKTANKLEYDIIIEVPIEDIQIGDFVVVRVGEQVPVDGIIKKGITSFDQQAITGESMPRQVFIKDQVFAGSINLEAQVIIETTKDPKSSVMQQMIDLVEKAQKEKSPSQTKLDVFEKWYVYVVIGMAIAMMILPPIFGIYDQETSFYKGIVILVVGSPCALVASISPAMLASLSSAAKENILIKSGRYLEILKTIDLVIFDKTGTITTGKPEVQNVVVAKDYPLYPLNSIINNMELQSTHPLAKAIVDHFYISSSLEIETSEIPGKGLEATYEGVLYQIGRFESESDPYLEKRADYLQKQGQTIVWVHANNKQVAFITLKDTIRKEAVDMISYLNTCRVDTLMLTGDQRETAHNIANTVGIKRYIANCFPKDKLEIIKQNQHNKKVLMVGDGLNDAPALTQANLGVAMGTGTDVSLETADMIIMNDDLSSLPYLFKLAKKMHVITTQNIIFALSIIITLLISNVFLDLALPLGVIGHEGSTILVILNSLRLLKQKK